MRSGKKSSRGGGVAQSDRLSKHFGQFARSVGLGAALNYSRRMAMSYRTGVSKGYNWVERADDQVTARSRAALGRRGQGNLLDVACGPGVVTAAITRGAASVIAFRNRGDAFTR